MPKTYELDLADYWRIVKRRRWIVLVTLLTLTSGVWFHSSRLPHIYEATATIEIEKPFNAGSMEATGGGWDSSDYIETQMQVLGSQGVAKEAAVFAKLIDAEMPVEEKHEPLISQFEGINTSRRGQTNIIDLSATSDDPTQAALIVNMVAHGYQVWSLKDHNEQARKVRIYINNLVKETEKDLNAKEMELKQFKEKSPMGASIAAFQQQLIDMELKLSTLLEKYTHRHPEVIELSAQIGNLKAKLAKYPKEELTLNQLTREVETTRTTYTGLRQKYEDAKIAEAQTVSGVTILNESPLPGYPISPNVRKNTMVGALVALILGLLLAFVKENVDTSISTIEEVEDFLQIPILGVIPEMVSPTHGEEKWSWNRLLRLLPFKGFQRSSGSDVSSPEDVRKLIILKEEHQFSALEAYKTLRTNVNFAVGQKKGQLLEITSTGAREGKSLTSLNLGLSLAQNGSKTCLIAADLRRETTSRMLGIPREPGLVDILTKDRPWQEVIKTTTDLLLGELPADRILQTTGIDNFSLIASGRLPHNPAELLSLDKMKTLLEDLRKNFDFVIVDTPPILPVSDASIIAPCMDGVILVYQVGRTARGALKRAKVQIASTGANILGVVLNNIKAAEMKMAPTYYYYREYYGADDTVVRERRKKHHPDKWWQRLWARFAPSSGKAD